MSIITAILKNNWIEKLIKNKPNDILITILLQTKLSIMKNQFNDLLPLE